MRIYHDDQVEDVVDKFRRELNKIGIMLILKESGNGFEEYSLEKGEDSAQRQDS